MKIGNQVVDRNGTFWKRKLNSLQTHWSLIADELFPGTFWKGFNTYIIDNHPTNIFWDVAGNLTIGLAVAGYKKESIKIKIEGDILFVEFENPRNWGDYYSCIQNTIKGNLERRKYNIGSIFHNDKITSTYIDGLLSIVLPLKKEFGIFDRKPTFVEIQ